MAAFPGELIDYIIDFLHHDEPALRACSTVSLRWLGSSRYHLFRHIRLGQRTRRRDRCHRLYMIISSSPDLALYIVEVVLHIQDWHILADQFLPLLLPSLTSLETIWILSRTVDVFEYPLPHPIMLAIGSLPLLKNLRVQHLHIPYLDYILEILRSCRRIKVLNVENLRFGDLSSPDARTVQPIGIQNGSERTSIEELMIDNGVLATAFIGSQSPIDISALRLLEVRAEQLSYSPLTNLIHAATSLERLEVILDADLDLCPPIDLSYMFFLNTLAFDMRALLGRENPLPWLHAVLSSIPAINCLDSLSLVFTIDIPPPNLSVAAYRDFLNGWKVFDALFAQIRFVPLKRVRIDFRIDNIVGDQIVQTVVDDIVTQLHRLHEKGVLHVDSCETGFG
ncbi:hypothetical protein FPV67DRAFT_1666061 [Lyophyllum atratum]|nr:hypothetical protein FPV67DRAFT_1666061 [Lyophyllum atratum]